MKIFCKHCGRYLMTAVGTVVAEGIICSNSKCRARLNVKVCNSSSSSQDIRAKFAEIETPPRLQRPPTKNHNNQQG